MAYTQQDELAAMFARGMQFAPIQEDHAYQQSSSGMSKPLPPLQTATMLGQDQVVFASSHYAHTAHIRTDNASETSNSPPPPYHENQMPEELAQVFRDHSIDPNALLQSQVHLFANAEHDQRLRLLELWRISPPSYPFSQHLRSVQIPTSMSQEIAQARERYEAKMQARQGRFDTHIEIEPITPIREAHEPAFPPAARMRAASIASSRPQTRHGAGDAEPYILTGYQAPDPRRSSAVDPVYAAASGLWQAPSYAHAMQQQSIMADQYGSYQQIRNHADWEAMNEWMARETFGSVQQGGHGGNDEMEL
ncbi:hypothetical protein LTR95_002713 [Oleoguttula sp. CCFEE 5521]